MGVNLRLRSCRYMPPEDYADFGDPRPSNFSARGARSYSDIVRRYQPVSGPVGKQGAGGIFQAFKGLLQKLCHSS